MYSRDALLHLKNARILVVLKTDGKKWYASSLAKEVGLSYVYVSELLDGFERDGLIEIKKEGRVKRVYLTESGLKIANLLDELLSKLNTVQPDAGRRNVAK